MSESAAEATVKSGFSSGNLAIPLPRSFGRLLLLRLLARGGMGDVYLAATTGIEGAERPCVVKTVRRDHIHDGSFLARFLDEARVQAQLNHPGVAQVIEAASDENGEPYTVVEYVEGRSLADVRQRAIQLGTRIEWPEAVAIGVELGQALAHVHERAGSDGTPLGIVHRDLSPQNVMVGYAGELKLIDFGTARGQNRKCHTVAGVVFAKPGYVAPEVARQEVGDGRIDVYAMGVMLWELCAGKRLLAGDPQKHLEEVAQGRFTVPSLPQTRGVPDELDAILQRLVANDPDERYLSASHAAKDLAKLLQSAPAKEGGERSVRSRIGSFMKTLWPSEPARSRAEFGKLLKQARLIRSESVTPSSAKVAELQAAHMTDDPAMLAGTPYRLGKKIGEGESGQVFEAEHIELGRKLAVKVLAPTQSSAHDAVERFRREARVVANLKHPNLVHLHDFGKALDGRVFLAMELLDGETLDSYARLDADDHASRGLRTRDAVDVCVQITHALETAHAAGLVHRDLKPQNLFMTRTGIVKLLDFGVAMALSDVEGAEGARPRGFAIFGTPEYMAPEQVAGEPVDERCDIYALGCVLYQLLTGVCPFSGTSGVAIMGKQLRDAPESFALIAPDRVLPAAIEAIVMRALSKSRDERYPNARAMREALEAALARTERRRGVGRVLVGLAGLASLAVLFAGGATYARQSLSLGQFASLGGSPSLTAPVVAAAPPIPEVLVDSLPRAVEPTPAPAEPPPAVAAVAAAEPSANTANTATLAAATTPRAAPPAKTDPHAVTTLATAEPPAPKAGEEAKAAYQEAQEEPPAPAKPLLQRATARDSRGEAGSELEVARRQAAARPQDPKALRAWARAAHAARASREARRAAREWAANDPGAEPRLFLAKVLDSSGHSGEAKQILDDWLAKHPDSTEARRLRARLTGARKPTRR